MGFPNVTNASWGRYDTLYLNPFDSCCWDREMDDWTTLTKVTKTENPNATVFATFHEKEIWSEDLVEANRLAAGPL